MPLRGSVFAVGLLSIALAQSGAGSRPWHGRHAVAGSLAAGRRTDYGASRSIAAGAGASAAGGRCPGVGLPEPSHPLTRPQWLTGVVITEYYPAPERWFIGRRVTAPGLAGTYAIDWLYSARGVAMQGDGVDRRGRRVHIARLGSGGWVNAAGSATHPRCVALWSNGSPAWRSGGWRDQLGAVTFPLAGGRWSNGHGVRQLGYGKVSFGPGPSLALHYYRSIAVDPKLIPLGSRVYIPAYRRLTGGWFVAQDTGSAIKGPHVDVYRPAPASPDDRGRYMRARRIYVTPPDGSGGHSRLPRGAAF